MQDPSRRRFLLGALAGAGVALLGPGVALAKYRPYPLHELILTSEAIAIGTITKVGAKTVGVSVEETILGKLGASVEVGRFRDWTCAARWTSYKKGQRLLLFLKADQEGAYKAIGAGNEGEMPILGDKVFVEVVHIGGIAESKRRVYGGDLYGHEVALGAFVDAVGDYRKHFEVGGQRQFGVAVKTISDKTARAGYAKRSPVHEWLVKASLES